MSWLWELMARKLGMERHRQASLQLRRELDEVKLVDVQQNVRLDKIERELRTTARLRAETQAGLRERRRQRA